MRWLLSGKPGAPSLMLDRINALSDGVIAVVITLLVLGIEVPKDHQFSTEGFFSFLKKIEYQLVVYAISFALVGTYWLQHNAMFHFLRHGTRMLIWLNLLFLFLVTLVPFVTDLIGTYRYEPLVMIIFAAVNMACSLSLVLLWLYANHVAPVVWPGIDASVVRSMTRRILIGPALCLIAVAVSFVSVRIGPLGVSDDPPRLCLPSHGRHPFATSRRSNKPGGSSEVILRDAQPFHDVESHDEYGHQGAGGKKQVRRRGFCFCLVVSGGNVSAGSKREPELG